MSTELGPLIKRGAVSGLAFGTAVSLAHVTHGIGLILVLGLPALTSFALQSVVMEVVLGGLMGALFAPLFRWRDSEWVHQGALLILWVAVERWVAVDPTKILMWLGPPLGALLFLVIGKAAYARRPALAYGLACMPLLLIAAPEVRDMGRSDEVHAVDVQRGTPTAGAPDVLFIVMDTVRAQSSSVYGYERDTTPVLEQLATEGLLFEDANSPATWSLPAHAALFTGTFPSYNNANSETRFLPGKPLPTIAEEFAREGGYETRCFSANPHISDSFGLTRGFMYNDKAWLDNDGGRNFSFIFRVVDAIGIGGATDKGGAKVIGNIEEWMDSRPADAPPQFVFVNFLEAHFPFHQLPAEFRDAYHQTSVRELNAINQIAFGVQFGRQLTPAEVERVHQPLVDVYDAGVKYTDFLVGETVDIWRKKGLLDNTIVVIVGDHGEVVGEHGAYGHVTPVVEEDFRVPLLFRFPPKIAAGVRHADSVSIVGIYATLMELAGLQGVAKPQVGSLLGALSGEEVGKPVLSERYEEHTLSGRFAPGTANGTGEQVDPRGRYRTYRSGPWKLVQHWDEGNWREHLFNLETDPGELNDVASKRFGELDELKAELDEWRAELGLPDLDAAVDAPKDAPKQTVEEIEALIKLGYIDEAEGRAQIEELKQEPPSDE